MQEFHLGCLKKNHQFIYQLYFCDSNILGSNKALRAPIGYTIFLAAELISQFIKDENHHIVTKIQYKPFGTDVAQRETSPSYAIYDNRERTKKNEIENKKSRAIYIYIPPPPATT